MRNHESPEPSRKRVVGALVLLLILVAGIVNVSLKRSLPALGWPDEWIYLTLARNIVEKGTLNTNFYIASSIERIGYPHHDVHLPGYALALASVAAWNGYSFKTAVALNIACFAVSVLSAFVIARRFFTISRSLIAAGLVALMPPYPGYLAIAYPEHVTAAALLALVAMAAWAEGRVPTFVVGFLLGVALLFRETLLFAGPLFVGLFGWKRSVRFFVPGFLLAIFVVLPPLSTRRAVHPNALYPSAVTEALASEHPVARLTATVTDNARTNLDLLFSSSPSERTEDAVLLFVLLLAGAAVALSYRLPSPERTFVRTAFVSTALLFAAMVVIYVVRERGGVWGGVRALMPMAPLFVIGLCGLRFPKWPAVVALTALIGTSLYLDARQIAFFKRYKETNLEDQDRAATFIEARTKRFAPLRVAGGRYFQYGFRNYPVEVVWSGGDDIGSLNRLYAKFPFDMVVIHRRSNTRFDLRKDPRYEWVNADEGQAAEYQIYRRIER